MSRALYKEKTDQIGLLWVKCCAPSVQIGLRGKDGAGGVRDLSWLLGKQCQRGMWWWSWITGVLLEGLGQSHVGVRTNAGKGGDAGLAPWAP